MAATLLSERVRQDNMFHLFKRLSVLALIAGTGCAATPRSVVDLEAQLRTLRQDNDRQARLIQQLESRISLAEDTARTANRAAQTIERTTVHIVDENPDHHLVGSAEVESIPTALHEDGGDDPETQEDPNRPIVRAAGRPMPLPISASPIVVREEDRLPVVPLPNSPGAQSPSQANPGGANRGPSVNSVAPGGAQPATQTDPSQTLAPGGLSSARDPQALAAYDTALAHARSGGCTQALGEFQTFLSRWPDHPMADNAMYWRGECTLEAGDVRAAANQFASVVQRFPYGHKVPDSIFKLAICFRRLGDGDRAREWSDRLQREFPSSELNARLRAEVSR